MPVKIEGPISRITFGGDNPDYQIELIPRSKDCKGHEIGLRWKDDTAVYGGIGKELNDYCICSINITEGRELARAINQMCDELERRNKAR